MAHVLHRNPRGSLFGLEDSCRLTTRLTLGGGRRQNLGVGKCLYILGNFDGWRGGMLCASR